ncbi:MAG: D-aminoacyl-tRNA deacylase [Candidatus Izemoplasmatales bacterium]
MKVVVQRVSRASVAVDGTVVGSIGKGYVLLVGFAQGDTIAEVMRAARKIALLRVFSDEAGRLNKNVTEAGGAILSISQFTLYGDVSEGNRPSFTKALAGREAEPLFDAFNFELSKTYGIHVETGVFGAHMAVDLENDGPVTILAAFEREGL